jgi:anti-sigma B factor antagonist
MRAGSFAVTVERDHDVARLRLSGELDLAGTERLDEALQEARAHAAHVEVDLRDLVFIDSSGLRALMALHNTAAETDGSTYALVAGPPEIHRTFVLTGLDRVFRFADAPAAPSPAA